MDQGDPPSYGLAHDFVPEHGPRRSDADLLHVGPAEPAREHAHTLALSLRLGMVDEPRLARFVEDDGAHRAILGPVDAHRSAPNV
jgi:hypothetical protein